MRLSILSLVAATAITLGGCKKNEAEQGVPKPAEPTAPAPAPTEPAPVPTAPAPAPSDPAAPTPTAPAPSDPAPTPTAPAPAPTAPAPSKPPTGAPPSAPSGGGDLLKVLGQPCGSGDSCATGTTCETYYGIAGPSGPAFKSCEIKCKSGGTECPLGASCVTVADGPGSVCRPQ